MHRFTKAFACGMTSLLLLAATASPLTEQAMAKGRFKTVTRTFNNPTTLELFSQYEAYPLYPSPIDVSGFKKGKVLDVNLRLPDFSHAFPRDVDILLAAPDDRKATVMSDVGSGQAQHVALTLDDEATELLPVSGTLTSGAFQPVNDDNSGSDTFPSIEQGTDVALSTFDGANPNGQWALYVYDDKKSSSGKLVGGWELTITAKVKNKKKHHKH